MREKKDRLLFSSQLARFKKATEKECPAFWQMLNKQPFQHPGCFENIYTFHVGAEKFKFQGEGSMWCSEDLLHKRHKQCSCEDVTNKQMGHFLIKCLGAKALLKKLHIKNRAGTASSSHPVIPAIFRLTAT